MTDYLILFAILLGVNMMPAFGPPTWAIIALYSLNTRLSLPALVFTGALAAALGRYLLAWAFRLLGDRLSPKTKRNLAAAQAALKARKRNVIIALTLFALSPVPSAQLFEAAGLAKVRLLGFTIVFFAGRIVSYTIYALTARRIQQLSLGEAFRDAITSPSGLAVQLFMIALLVLLTRIDWSKHLPASEEPPAAPRG